MFKFLRLFRMVRNNKGEVSGPDPKGNSAPAGKTFTQEEVDHLIGQRLARTKEQYQDYDDLKKFREEHVRKQSELEQQDLIKQKKYEEAENKYKQQLTERDTMIAQKDESLKNMRITHAITSAATALDGYVEETVALVKNNAVITNDGVVVMKIKDANGFEKEVSIDEGLKSFYASRPHLVKAQGRSGGGTPPAGGQGGGNNGAVNLATLNADYYQAMMRGDRKLMGELMEKMKPLMKGNRNAM